MKNLADIIESFIVRELLADEADQILVQRNELAVRLSCAPSQISYVLSTRFTPERGYIVESRRGSGGFVRIARQTDAQEIERDGEEDLPFNKEFCRGKQACHRRGRAAFIYDGRS